MSKTRDSVVCAIRRKRGSVILTKASAFWYAVAQAASKSGTKAAPGGGGSEGSVAGNTPGIAVSDGTGKLKNEKDTMGIDMRVSVAGRLEEVVVTAIKLEAKLAVTSDALVDDGADADIDAEELVAFPADVDATLNGVEPEITSELELATLDWAWTSEANAAASERRLVVSFMGVAV